MPGPEADPKPIAPGGLCLAPWWRRSWLAAVLTGTGAGLVLAAAGETGYVMFGRNFHTVIPGRVYRCAQLQGDALERTIRAYGIRTVVNLRGSGLPWPWYLGECRVTHRLGVNQEDVSFSASRLPSTDEVRQLLRVLDHADYPLLLHCRQGADRTGLAAAAVVLLQTDATLEEARRQLGPRYGHLRVDRAGHLDRFYDLYAEWLGGQALTHTPALFRRWADNDYCPGECRCDLEPLELPEHLRLGEPTRIRVRARNTGLKPWRLRPENHTGIHMAFILKDAQDRGVFSGRSGLFDAQVAPGGAIDLTLVLPAVRRPGRYRLQIDMVDEQHCWFYQTGSQPLQRELEVP